MLLSYTQKKEELKVQPAHAPSCDQKISAVHLVADAFSGNADPTEVQLEVKSIGDDEYPDTTIEALEKAAADGLEVIEADDYTLMIDLDTAEDVSHWERIKYRLKDVGIKDQFQEEWASKSGNKHVLIRLMEPLPVIHRIGLQAALGSDRKREFLSFRDVLFGYAHPVMLFRPMGAAVTRSPKEAEATDDGFIF